MARATSFFKFSGTGSYLSFRVSVFTMHLFHTFTLGGSKHANMKELRFTAHAGREVWRAAFAFDPERRAILLVAGEKQGTSQALFY